MDHPEGAGLQRADRVEFDPRVRLEFRGTQLSSDGGLLVMRELDDALGLSGLASAALRETRRGKNTVHRLDGLFRQSVYGRLAGYEDVNDADRLALDPVMRQVVGGRAVDAQAASTSQMGRFETETMALAENRAALADLNGQWIDRFHDRNGLKFIVLDMDSSVSPTHGDQEGAAWNGHFDCTCYHPNFLFNQFGMLERCALRHGNVHSADGWRGVLDPVIARYAKRDILRFFRADAAYAIPAIYERLEEAGYFYAIRLPANNVLREKIAHRLTRPVGRPSLTKVKRFFEDFHYQAASWDKERRVIAKIDRMPEGRDVHIVMDNYATHKTPRVKAWLARRPHWHVHFTPTSASWLNQVERWFAELTRKQIQRGVHRSVAELEADIAAFIDAHNENPKPYKWVKSADEILASVKRSCQKTLAGTSDSDD
jgi:hypothetical protein